MTLALNAHHPCRLSQSRHLIPSLSESRTSPISISKTLSTHCIHHYSIATSIPPSLLLQLPCTQVKAIARRLRHKPSSTHQVNIHLAWGQGRDHLTICIQDVKKAREEELLRMFRRGLLLLLGLSKGPMSNLAHDCIHEQKRSQCIHARFLAFSTLQCLVFLLVKVTLSQQILQYSRHLTSPFSVSPHYSRHDTIPRLSIHSKHDHAATWTCLSQSPSSIYVVICHHPSVL